MTPCVCNCPGVRLPFVQYVASLAIVEAVQEQARVHLQVCSLTLNCQMNMW